jgi:hypothetical protein
LRASLPPEPAKDRRKAERRQSELPPPDGRKRQRRSGLVGRLVFLLLALTLALGLPALSGRTFPLPVWAVAEIEDRLDIALDRALPGHAAAVGGLTLTIGADWAPQLDIEDLTLLRPSGRPLLTLPETHLTLDPGSLLRGLIQPRTLRIVGARFAIRRDSAGRFDLDLGESQTPAPRLESPAQAFALIDRAFAQPAFARLSRIEAEALSLSLYDQRLAKTFEVGDGRLSIDNRAGELAAQLSMTLVAGGQTPAQAVLTAVIGKGTEEARLSAEVGQVSARDLASAAPALGWLGVLDAPISGRIATQIDTRGITGFDGRLEIGAGALQPTPRATPIAFDRASLGLGYDPALGRILLTDLSLQSQTLRLSAKGQAYMIDAEGQRTKGALGMRIPQSFLGQLSIADLSVDPEGLFAAPVQFSQGAIDIRLALDPFTLDIGQFTLAEGADRLSLKGRVAAGPKGWTTAVDLDLNRISRDRLLAIWPLRLVTGTRNWVRDNIRNAQLSDVRAALRLAPGQEPRADISYAFNDAELRFLPKMPPVTGADGYSTIQGRTYSLVLSQGGITPPQGGRLDAAGTVFAVPDITKKPADAAVDLQLKGPLEATLSLLDQPPFLYLQKAGLPVDLGTGTVRLQAKIGFPLIARVLQEHIAFDVDAEVADFASAKLVKGHEITAPKLKVKVTTGDLTISGKGRIGKVPFDVALHQAIPMTRLTQDQIWMQQRLKPGEWIAPNPVAAPPLTLTGTVLLSAAAVEEFRLGLPKTAVTGEGLAQVDLTLPKGSPGTLTLTSDLAGLTLAIPELGWRKGPKQTGKLAARITLGTPADVPEISLEAPGLSAKGAIKLRPDGLLDRASFAKVVFGRWLNGGVEIRGRGADPVDFALTSGMVDLREFPETQGTGKGARNRIPVRLDRLRVSEDISLTGLAGDFTLTGGFNGTFSGKVNDGTAVTGTVVPTRNGPAVRIESEDAGGVARSAGLFSTAHGGALTLSLLPTETSGTYDGTARITNTRVRYDSVIADLLSAISVVGLLDQLNGDGIVFDRVESQFRLTPAAVEIQRGSAIGLSMGVSLAGRYDNASRQLNMNGVVSPLYLLNGIGAILTRKGEGLFGFNYTLTGPAAQPVVRVNPLSILTPGMLRELFRAPSQTGN